MNLRGAETADLAALGDDPSQEPSDAQVNVVIDRAPGGRSFIARQYVAYPFHITRPFYMDRDPSGMLTLYLQSVAGGIYEHDHLSTSVSVQPGAKAQVTTQASTIAHSMRSGEAVQEVYLHAGAGAMLEYLPDPLILFPLADVTARLHLVADEASSVLLTDAYLGHDPAGAGGKFERLFSETRIERPDGWVLAIDRFDISGDMLAADAPGITGNSLAQGTLFVLDRDQAADELVEVLEKSLTNLPGVYAGVSTLPGEAGAWARIAATDGAALSAGMQSAWRGLRRHLTGLDPVIRRK